MSQMGVTATEQYLLNSSFDPDTGVLVVMPVGFDGVSAVKQPSQSVAMKVTQSGDITYMAFAAPGTAQGTAKWQVKKIDASGGIVTTWADGNANFDNIATDLTTLDYS